MVVAKKKLEKKWEKAHEAGAQKTSPAANGTTVLREGFWELGPAGARVQQTLRDAHGRVLDRRWLFGGRRTVGNATYAFDRAAEPAAVGVPYVEVTFEKQD